MYAMVLVGKSKLTTVRRPILPKMRSGKYNVREKDSTLEIHAASEQVGGN
jgi:hypothetical protein